MHMLDNTPDHWRTKLLIHMATANLLQCNELVEGLQAGNVSRVAWATRNLLELHYFVRYIVESPENAERFREDMVCDYQDLMSFTARHAEYAPFAVVGQQVLDHLWDRHINLAKKNDNYLKPDAIAKRLGEGHHYTTVMKFLSKFVHPTSLSIYFNNLEPWKAMFIPATVETAARLIGDTFPRLAKHIREYAIAIPQA